MPRVRNLTARRSLHINGGPALVVSSLISIDVARKVLYVEQLGDGTFRVSCSKALADVSSLQLVELVRPGAGEVVP
jgi:hypothetical protein